MKIKDLKKQIENLDDDLDVYASDPDNGNIIFAVDGLRVVIVKLKNEFGLGNFSSHDFPIGHKLVKLT